MPDSLPVTFDPYGRMRYHPEFHAKQKAPWTTTEEKYLIENYAALGPEQISFTLERTILAVMTRACALRKAGKMPTPAKRTHSKRMKPEKEKFSPNDSAPTPLKKEVQK